jgi:hypothetical protein
MMRRSIILVFATLALLPWLGRVACTGRAGASQSQSQPMSEEICDAERTGALHRCAHYTDAGRDRCDAMAEKAYKTCLMKIPKPRH